jgi:uncharacterized protein (UPF0332 family)
MNGREFLVVAQVLLGDSREAAHRSAISRAYYAAFHVARHLMEDLGFTISRADRAHAYLWLRLSNSGEPHVELAGRELNDLRGDRNHADYDVVRRVSHADAAGRVRIAERIMQILDSAAAEPTRTSIVDAMKTYERDVLHDITWHP